jgi:ribonuclease HII
LAGPVVACAVILDPDRIPEGLNDSKALSQVARERLLNKLKDCAEIGVGIAEPVEIERKNILWASMAAMERAVGNLSKPDGISPFALIDGNRVPPGLSGRAEALVKGDARSVSIAAASIVAKVVRDRLMEAADLRFPGYDLARHKGYPTRAHREAVSRLGPCPLHRVGFGDIGTLL